MERNRRNRNTSTNMRRFLTLIAGALLLCGELHAQDALSCETGYQEALRLYKDGQFKSADRWADSLLTICTDDRDQLTRTIFLRTLIAARLDSVHAMQRDLESLFRVDRNYALKPYDPLLIEIPQRDELYTNYQLLFGSRELGQGKLRKDHGRFRAGLMAGVLYPILEVATNRVVFSEDGPSSYSSKPGWSANVLVEYDIIPNLALRANGGINNMGYEVQNKAVRYEEDLRSYDLSLGLRKSFWIKDLAWVPYLYAGAGIAALQTANAHIERSGDGVRLLGPYDADRIGEREAYQYNVSGGAGFAYKIGHTAITLEGRYTHALTALTLGTAPYTESELLVRYYYADNDLRISQLVMALGVQYIIRYHKRNRIYR